MNPTYHDMGACPCDEESMTGDVCADKAIMAGKNPDPPDKNYQIKAPPTNDPDSTSPHEYAEY